MADLSSPQSTLGLYKLGERLDMASFGFVENPVDATCKYRKEVQDDGSRYEFVSSAQVDSPKAEDVERSFSPVKDSNLIILTVAIDAYPKGSPYLPLVYSTSDANAIGAFFLDQVQQKRSPFKSVQVKCLRDGQATREGIRNALEELTRIAGEDDVVLLFFSGHGKILPGQEMFYFIPYFERDAWGMNAFEESREAIATSVFVEVIRNIRARRIVFILDACESGGALESLRKIADVKLRTDGNGHVAPLPGTDQNHFVETGIYVVAAATPIQQAVQAREEKHGLLTYVLLQALNGHSAKPQLPVTIEDLVRFVGQELPNLAKHHNEPQTPLIVGVGPANFPLASHLE